MLRVPMTRLDAGPPFAAPARYARATRSLADVEQLEPQSYSARSMPAARSSDLWTPPSHEGRPDGELLARRATPHGAHRSPRRRAAASYAPLAKPPEPALRSSQMHSRSYLQHPCTTLCPPSAAPGRNCPVWLCAGAGALERRVAVREERLGWLPRGEADATARWLRQGRRRERCGEERCVLAAGGGRPRAAVRVRR